MKSTTSIPWFMLLLLLCSCIQDAPLNAEADIVNCIVDPQILRAPIIVENDRITLYVKSDTPLTAQAPLFELSPGASIDPASGSVLDFTNPQIYTVSSQDGQWKKSYTVSYISSGITTRYDFEHSRIERDVYDVFYEVDPAGSPVMEWASGNLGFEFTGVTKNRLEFPSYSDSEGKSGNALALVTRSTGSLGQLTGKPLAAGNLFMGVFDLGEAIGNPLKAVKLGVPFAQKPLALKGFYKYKAGALYTDRGKEIPGLKDQFDIYAVFFETDANTAYLDGTNKFTHQNIVSIARLPASLRLEQTQWTPFDLEFIPQPNKIMDPEKLKAGRYSITIVFASSVDGDFFKGAVNSSLLIDEVELICENQ